MDKPAWSLYYASILLPRKGHVSLNGGYTVAKKKWIQEALAGSKPGVLRRRLKVKTGETIPLKKLKRAAAGAYGPVTKKRAQLALTLRKLRRKR